MDTMTLSTVILTVVTTAYCIITFLILKANQRSVDAMHKQVEASTRPYVVFDLVPEGPIFEVVLRNTGQTAAINLSIAVTPRLVSRVRDHDRVCTLTDKPITFFAPGREIREFIGNWQEVRQLSPSLEFSVHLQYWDVSNKSFTETFKINLWGQDERVYIGRPDPAEELKKISDHMEGIKKSISK
ncbi:MAG: hypothetical protein Q8M07_18545 [Prosthecobacter sp.]|nr:hypothetical protein [Prosthecobacter sp.]